jgi:AraC-like DNA-binding protein/mannose-6-phosphate isomerase-like protein (cupin superfamily)
MRRVSELERDDALSDVLRAGRVRSTVWCVSDLAAPWAFGVARREAASFHLVLRGRGLLDVDGGTDGVPVVAGELVVLAHGHAHALRDAPTTPVRPLDELLTETPLVDGRLTRGPGPNRTEILCGGFVLEGRSANPLLALLPPVLHVRQTDWLEGTIELLRRELPTFAPGADAVVTRLTDVVLTQAIRHYLAETGHADALRDPFAAAAVRLLHERPDHPWTVPELARRVALSRSAFSQRFRAATGESPRRYLTRLRMARAAEELRTGDAPVYEVARRSGYDSEVSFSKAFSRALGVSPGRYRRLRAGAPLSP